MGAVVGFPEINPTDAAIGARIRHWRDYRHMTAEDLAHRLDLTPQALKRVEEGRQHLDSAAIDAATRALSLPIWALMTDQPAY